MRGLLVTLLLCMSGVLVSCAEPGGPSEAADATATGGKYNKKLHDQLIGMLKRDQRERMGGALGEGDEARTERLKKILDKHGWPTYGLVGEDGEDAAWAIAQHSDHDLAFQKKALELLRVAVAVDQASPGNLAYLTDRVAVAQGKPQSYGTQVGCGPNGPAPATPIRDKANVEERRKAAGLDPLADYLDEMTAICNQG